MTRANQRVYPGGPRTFPPLFLSPPHENHHHQDFPSTTSNPYNRDALMPCEAAGDKKIQRDNAEQRSSHDHSEQPLPHQNKTWIPASTCPPRPNKGNPDPIVLLLCISLTLSHLIDHLTAQITAYASMLFMQSRRTHVHSCTCTS